ncbi:endonuclease [Pseudooceanicola sp.]|uniref:endonuclease n=1 Tax=Pseudooceanicola sp. TaxID=1914328 RepID=UPI003441C8B9
MDLQTKEGRCSAICWIIGVVVAIVAYSAMRPAVWILVALVIAALVGCAVALLLIRFFCASQRSQDSAGSQTGGMSPGAMAAPVAAPAPTATAAPAPEASDAATGATSSRAAGIVPADGATAEYDEAQEGMSTAATSAAAYDAPEGDKAWEDAAEEPAETAEEPAEAKPAAASASDAGEAGRKPQALSAARDGVADDLKRIKGVGPKLEILLNELGIYHFDQVAAWGADEVAWVDQNLKGFKGRVSRDGWVAQATTLAAGGETEFSQRVDKGGVY